jgi:PAP2 superfamily
MRQKRWIHVARDAAPVLLALALCPLLAVSAPGRAGPLERMRDFIHVERALGLFVEPHMHAWVAARPPLLHALELSYVGVHLPVTLGVLVWVWLARPQAFPLARNTFVAAQVLSAVGYLVVPTAPPRMVAGLGYSAAAGPADHGIARLLQSPYAAMPSAHTAFALISAGIVFSLARSRAVRLLALLYPPAVLAEILATGNHIWLDAVGGASVAAIGFGIALGLRARRRDVLVATHPPSVPVVAVSEQP